MSRRCVAFRATLLLACCVFLPACRCRRPLEKGKAKGIAACLAVKVSASKRSPPPALSALSWDQPFACRAQSQT